MADLRPVCSRDPEREIWMNKTMRMWFSVCSINENMYNDSLCITGTKVPTGPKL